MCHCIPYKCPVHALLSDKRISFPLLVSLCVSRSAIANVHIVSQANIYLLMPLQHVAIFGCTNCTIILGTVSRMVTIEHCEKVLLFLFL